VKPDETGVDPDGIAPVPVKPFAEMTRQELRAFAAELRRRVDRPRRERKLRRGQAMPKTMRECDIFGADLKNPPPRNARQ